MAHWTKGETKVKVRTQHQVKLGIGELQQGWYLLNMEPIIQMGILWAEDCLHKILPIIYNFIRFKVCEMRKEKNDHRLQLALLTSIK